MQYRGFLRRDRHYGRSDGSQSTAGHGGGRYDAVMNIEWRGALETEGGWGWLTETDGNRGSSGGKQGGIGRRGRHV